ncbi:uncharacterized protein LOC105699978 [Orussus abietinus]|uniref:uncharacterized protein LOC105699978 n=1 Tax=Orussus abietinus TaxID=222816 RepID=UPI0006250BA6|nr:uncharacterized protein LOC105699978 [Orussus abietinus]XP_023290606.1 uncharacterized protein LOC105699978 [Orussus abietinus]
MRSRAVALQAFLIGSVINHVASQSCSKEQHQKCIALADPLLKDPHLIFPDNMPDIDMVCRTWSSFVDCIRKYIDTCFSKERKEQFNMAVELPISSVHQMCSVPTYQSEYLIHASCIKATVIEEAHCGTHYAALVEEVSKRQVARTSLCCSHHHFRTCVVAETRKKCDNNQNAGPAARFSRQVLDKALSFLRDQCQNYIPNSGDCPNPTEGPMPLSVSPLGEGSENFLGTKRRPHHHHHHTASPNDYSGQSSDVYDSVTNTIYPTRFRSTGRALNLSPTQEPAKDEPLLSTMDMPIDADKKAIGNSYDSAVPSKVGGDMEDEVIAQVETTSDSSIRNEEQSAVIVTQRQSTYGRGMSWASSSTEPPAEIPAWATGTWLTSNQIPVTDESWYPEAGSFGGNHIDEPNQQGLSKNGHWMLCNKPLFTTLIAFVLYIL